MKGPYLHGYQAGCAAALADVFLDLHAFAESHAAIRTDDIDGFIEWFAAAHPDLFLPDSGDQTGDQWDPTERSIT